MATTLAGKLMAVYLNDVRYRCQTDATLTITANVSEDDPCKPEAGETIAEAGWVKRNVDSRDWNITFSAKAFADDLAANNSDVTKLMVDGDLDVEVEFKTNPGQHDLENDLIYSGPGILTSFSLAAPAVGSATYDVEVSGNGPLAYEKIPVTPTP